MESPSFLRAVRCVIIVVATVSIWTCKFPSTSSPPPKNPGSVSGHVAIPSGVNIDPKSITIGAGINGTLTPDSNGNYQIQINPQAPVLAVAITPAENPLLMNIFDSAAPTNDLDVETTAATLVFMGLGLYTESSTTWRTLLSTISNVLEVKTLASLIGQKLATNPDILSVEPPDQAIVNSLDAAMDASMTAVQSSNTMSILQGTRNVAKSIDINPTSAQGGLSLSANEYREITATNIKQRYVSLTVDGPSVSGIHTLVSPASFYDLLPSATVLNPDPLPAPSQGATDTYTIRVRGGLDNRNYLYDKSLDDARLTEALMFSGVMEFLIPFEAFVLGVVFTDGSLGEVCSALVELLSAPVAQFAADVVDAVLNGHGDLGQIAENLVLLGFKACVTNDTNTFLDILAKSGVDVAKMALADCAPVGRAFGYFSALSLGSGFALAWHDLKTTHMVDVYTVSVSLDSNSIYNQDFSSNPSEWITNNPANYYWRGNPNFDYHIYYVNDSGEYAYVPIPNAITSSFQAEWDFLMDSNNYASGVIVGLFDDQMIFDTPGSTTTNIVVNYGRGDLGHNLDLYGHGSDGVDWGATPRQYPSSWQYATWYHQVLSYDASNKTVHLLVTQGKGRGGTVQWDISASNVFYSTLTRFGISCKKTGSQRPGATGTGEIDNVVISRN